MGSAFTEAAEFGQRRERLEREQQRVTGNPEHCVHVRVEQGWSVRDIGPALRTTPGRVSRIVSTERSA